MYVSSGAAYDHKDFAEPGITEDAPLAAWDGRPGNYSRDKAESERRLHALIGEKLTIVRPGGIKGPRDDTPGDLLAWLRRLQSEPKVIAPGDGSCYVEVVDVCDVARFLVMAIDQSIYGTFNLTGRPMTFRRFLQECQEVARSNAELIWIPETFLREQGLGAANSAANWGAVFPYWLSDPARRGFFQISSQRAYNAGWETRPFRDTALDFLEYFATLYDRGKIWVPSHDGLYEWKDPLPREKEQAVIARWLNHS